MEEYVYLIRNGDLYNLGYSKNLEKTKENLTPGKLFAYLKTNSANSLCTRLQQKYLEERLPNTDYFRLNKSQLLECQLIMKNHGDKKW